MLQEICEDGHTLIIASVGNDGKNLNIKNTSGVYPSFIKDLPNCDKVMIRVGAINEHTLNQEPVMYTIVTMATIVLI